MKKLLLSLVLAVGMMNVQLVSASERADSYNYTMLRNVGGVTLFVMAMFCAGWQASLNVNRDKIYQEGYQEGTRVSIKTVNDQLNKFYNLFSDKQLYPEITNKSITGLEFRGTMLILKKPSGGQETIDSYSRLQNQKSMHNPNN